ncbi:MAG: DUF3285 domain-containing protein, partial [Leptolyngbyaceae cyanobacterium RM2_2_4]|nr:DUF3285 domain-containing protein [Leptolyngbyaceae cyanobacterium RM2_2_4]
MSWTATLTPSLKPVCVRKTKCCRKVQCSYERFSFHSRISRFSAIAETQTPTVQPTEPAASPAEPKPSYVKLAMRNMVE